jgi:hypothetical protein
MTLAGNTVYPYSSNDANFDPPQFRLDSTFKGEEMGKYILEGEIRPRYWVKNVTAVLTEKRWGNRS